MVVGQVDVNWIAVVVSAVVGFVVSWLWWGPLFGKHWMKLSGMKMTNDAKKGMGGKMLIAFIANVVMAWVLASVLGVAGASTMMSGVIVAFWLWLGFVATLNVGIVLWNGKPWGLFWLNSIGWLVTMAIMASVLVVWG